MKGTARKVEKLNEQALKDSELRHRSLFEWVQDGILILDAGAGMNEMRKMVEHAKGLLMRPLNLTEEAFQGLQRRSQNERKKLGATCFPVKGSE
jgi:hypothetical protein